MIRRPPRSTRTETLFPSTTLFRSGARGRVETPQQLAGIGIERGHEPARAEIRPAIADDDLAAHHSGRAGRSEEHTSELQSLMRISYAVFCLKKKKNIK